MPSMGSNGRPRVSVITIFLDGEAFLAEAIESVIAQTFNDWELLLVDDGSGPLATGIAKAYASRYPQQIYYLEHPGHVNRGMSATRNLGIQHASGEFVAFIDADDVWLPSKLTDQVKTLDAHPQIGMACSAAIYWSGDATDPGQITQIGHQQDAVISPPQPIVALYPLGTAHPACPSGAIIRASVVNRLGCFEEEFRGHLEDQAFFSKVYLTEPAYFSSSALFKYRRHSESSIAVLNSTGGYHESRLRFLEWFEAYLDKQPGQIDPRVAASLHRALRYYRAPRFDYLLTLPSRMRARCRRLSRRVAHLIRR